MAKRKSRRKSLRDPFALPPEDGDGKIQVVIETPKGSRNKYSFDPEIRIFPLKKVLPAGMTFPYDFGFGPSTKAEDGDPTDILVLMDEPAFPGCLLKCRIIGTASLPSNKAITAMPMCGTSRSSERSFARSWRSSW
jgi:inorganic pyrophosphatase